ncbi:Slp family lipoprotein [Pleionea mediterranea]|uniref:Outer membrane lipoprotein n=1 Tax=Pleionea mediterranea TaxID=523701 RepID=A0A316FM67_9GAMM|nr:Slp family lipoprotein [Pleionea mediterranea]PWK49978.1 outer membrane lipoprotein [Pleionea mediterranea]
MKQLVFVFMTAVVLAGCNTVPKSLQGDYKPVTLAEARKTEGSSVKVRWGGVIARVDNQERQSVIEIVAKPLMSSSRPRDVDTSGGRFLAIVPDFVDPVVYEKGREVTVVGELSDMVEGKIGEMKYWFPVVRTTSHHLWKKRSEVKQVHHWGTSFWPIFPHRYYYHPHWRYYPRKDGKGSSSSGKPVMKSKVTVPKRKSSGGNKEK